MKKCLLKNIFDYYKPKIQIQLSIIYFINIYKLLFINKILEINYEFNNQYVEIRQTQKSNLKVVFSPNNLVTGGIFYKKITLFLTCDYK